MLVFSPSETNLKLHHVAFAQPLSRALDAEGIVRLANIWAELDLFKGCPGALLLTLLLLILVLAIIHDFGNRYFFAFGHNDEIKTCFLRRPKSYPCVDDALIVTFLVDQQDLISFDVMVDLLFLSDKTVLLL